MKVLVTGANGLLGHHVVLELLERHYQVRIIVRSILNIYFDLVGVEVFEGNFAHYDTLMQAAEGCDAIIHIAAITATDLLYYEDYQPINVEGSALVIQVADKLNINKIVYISSANTVGFGSEYQAGDEFRPVQYPFSESYYARTKVEAEKLFTEAAKKPNRHIVIINPAFMIGAYDPKPSSGKLLLMGYNRKLMFIPRGGKNFIPVSDVAVVVCNTLTKGKNGERYLASGINLSFKEYYTLQKIVGGYKQQIVEVPGFLLKFLGKTGDLLRLLGIRTELCTMNICQLMIREYYTNRKAKEELGLVETELSIAIGEAIDWFKKRKKI